MPLITLPLLALLAWTQAQVALLDHPRWRTRDAAEARLHRLLPLAAPALEAARPAGPEQARRLDRLLAEHAAETAWVRALALGRLPPIDVLVTGDTWVEIGHWGSFKSIKGYVLQAQGELPGEDDSLYVRSPFWWVGDCYHTSPATSRLASRLMLRDLLANRLDPAPVLAALYRGEALGLLLHEPEWFAGHGWGLR